MNSLAVVAPILPGQLDTFHAFAKDVAGSRRREMDESLRALRVTRETIWAQHTPMGDLCLVYLEGEDVIAANRTFAASQSAYDRWFKEMALKITGVDFGQPLPANLCEPLFEMPPTEHRRSLAVAVPILPGKTDDYRKWGRELAGKDFADFLRRANLSRACLYLIHTPSGDMGLQYSEGDDPAAAYAMFAASTHPYDQRTKKIVSEQTGIDFGKPTGDLPETGFDYRNDELLDQLRAGTRADRRTDTGSSARPA